MNDEEMKAVIQEWFPAVAFEEGTEWLTLTIERESWKILAQRLRTYEEFQFDYLFCLTCIDWKTYLVMVYHLTSTVYRHTLVIKSRLDRISPSIENVSDIWATAEFHEREVFDLFGVDFKGHPDLRRLFMTDECKGWPLRKDYEDEVNMIRL